MDMSAFSVTPQELSADPKHPMRAPMLRLVELMWKKLIKDAHPDRGGSTAEMARLNRAIVDARAALGKPDPVDGVR